MDRLPGFRPSRSAEIKDEIQFYLEERARELRDQGLSEDLAWQEALRAFGDVGEIQQELNEIHRTGGRLGMKTERWQAAMRDVKYAVRGLMRSPTFTLVALATLALGLGANTAIYSLVHAALFRAPPVQNADELVAVYTTSRRGFPRSATSYPDFLDYRDRATLLQDLAATSSVPASLGHDRRGSRFISLEAVTGNYFPLLGVTAAHGRLLEPDDDRLGAGEPVIVLSFSLWRSHFLADPNVLGEAVRLNGTSFTVVGVAHPDFFGMSLSFRPDGWLSMQGASLLGQGSVGVPEIWEARGSRWMGMLIGRRAAGATTDQVRTQFVQISDGMKVEYGDLRGPRNTTVDPLSSYALPNGSEAQITQFVWLLLGVVGFTLLLACANLANLLLARATSRSREVAVRLALGAKRSHLVRQLLTESMIISLAGAALGLVVALGMLRILGPFQLPGGILVEDLDAALQGPVLGFTLGLALLTGVLFGLVPTFQATRPNLVGSLKADSRAGSPKSGIMLRKGLISVQVGLCLILLIGSGLFVATLREGMSHDLGFESDGVALARFNLGLLNYEPAEATTFLDDLKVRLERRPGAQAVSVSTRVPLQDGGAQGYFIEVPGYEPREDEEMRIDLIGASPGYFESLGIPLTSGRGILAADVPGGRDVAVVSKSMAETYWGGESPLDRTVVVSGTEVTIVGVAENVTWQGLADEPTNFVYYPLAMSPEWAAGFVTVAVRTAGDPSAALNSVREEILALEPDAPITLLQTMEDQVRSVLTAQETGAVLLSGFGVLALLLATIGIAGVVTYTVNQQRRDIGIRMALGAKKNSVVGRVVLSMTPPVLVGALIGILGAAALTRSVEGFLFGVNPTDARTYITITTAFMAVALVAAIVPARRATRIDPIEVLKAD